MEIYSLLNRVPWLQGYLTSEGLERLANLSSGSSNLILVDVLGTPEHNLPSTDEDDGPELTLITQAIDEAISNSIDSPSLIYDRSQVFSVEILRADAEGYVVLHPDNWDDRRTKFGITLFLSLQRLVQSQSREIAILRTLGVPRWAIMPSYVLMPLAIGITGSLFGSILGVYLGAPAMLAFYEDFMGIPILQPTELGQIVMQIVVVTTAVVLFSGILPAIQASRLQPLEVMRGSMRLGFLPGRYEITSRLRNRWLDH